MLHSVRAYNCLYRNSAGPVNPALVFLLLYVFQEAFIESGDCPDLLTDSKSCSHRCHCLRKGRLEADNS